ncbi:DNA-3-methyladenine glycosylase [uncultured Pseudokineococcus sp.]|uniref:DNA-3-methyladenine glycosylase family protein n=1 Tax=uncultured Pseudokineococcus sp. TaxID=1642928 RepID=UPI002605943F|nr:DNA-3-methyladenine glycosylase 2 family protein [uncultured Pseudokineococcus sp.]
MTEAARSLPPAARGLVGGRGAVRLPLEPTSAASGGGRAQGSAGGSAPRERTWRPGRELDVTAVLAPLRRGAGDPAVRRGPGGEHWWATRTPTGTGLLHLVPVPAEGVVRARAWGDGADHLLERVPVLLGDGDDDAGFAPRAGHHRLVEAHRRHRGWRVPRTGAVLEALAGAAVEQVVTGVEAHRGWRRLLERFGDPAPGAPAADGGPAAGMRVPPSATAWRSVPSWEWLRAGVQQRRSRVVQVAARSAGGLERTLALPAEQVEAALRSLPGVGVWTAAEVRQRAHGDADAFSFADYHVAKDVTWALTGEVLDDDACAELLEPYRGHRHRVQRLLSLAGHRRPRRGPRMTLPTHTPASAGGR